MGTIKSQTKVCVTIWLLLAVGAWATSLPSVATVLMQMERDWSRAGIRKDFKTLDRIMADDWVSVDLQGNVITKTRALDAVRAAASSGQSIELGAMKVRVFGSTAIVTGTGKDSSARYAWMDVFVKRNGRWQAVASQSTRLEK